MIFGSPLTPSSVLCRRNQKNRRKRVIPDILAVDCKRTWDFWGFYTGGGGMRRDGRERMWRFWMMPSSLLPSAAHTENLQHINVTQRVRVVWLNWQILGQFLPDHSCFIVNSSFKKFKKPSWSVTSITWCKHNNALVNASKERLERVTFSCPGSVLSIDIDL